MRSIVRTGEDLVEAAARIAESAHMGQDHSFGSGSYFRMHLEPVANIVRRLGYGATYIAGAYLHDSKEDTALTNSELVEEGIPIDVIHAIDLMTKRGEPHDIYLQGILESKIATVDKFADSSFNFAWSMVNSPTTEDSKFRERTLKYSHNVSVLRPHLPPVE